MLISYTTLSTNKEHILNDQETKKAIMPTLYAKTNWRTNTQQDTLANVISFQALIVISGPDLLVIDFDDNEAFKRAQLFNESLTSKHKCKFIVKSSRRGGHFYFQHNPDIEAPTGHTKQNIVDYLEGDKHNIIAPTSFDPGKTILEPYDTNLTQFNTAWEVFVTHMVLQNLPEKAYNIVLRSSQSHSDDNVSFVKQYLSNLITDADFNAYYNIPTPIPPGQSNEYYKNISTRLACDETVSFEDFKSAMEKFNAFHKRKEQGELYSCHINSMTNNGLWAYDADKKVNSFEVSHKLYKTPISVYYDIDSGEYLLSYSDRDGQPHLHCIPARAKYLELIEKLSRLTPQQRKTDAIPAVHTVTDYSLSYGYNTSTGVFNKAVTGPELAAFYGTKPDGYTVPTRLLDVCKHMWGEEYEYLLASTKYRYKHFRFSPVVTFLQGTEGSGKDLTVWLLTRPFPVQSQLLDASLLNDKHSNWQTEPNVIVSEVGDWRAMDRDSLLAKVKTIAGSNGIVTFRGMNKTAITQPSLIKIWVTGNKWVKLHTDPLSQRRIHPVYMPRPLNKELGGPYSEGELRSIFSHESVLNFYYWLGNESDSIPELTLDQYIVPTSRHSSESYEIYQENTQTISDTVSQLIYSRDYNKFQKALNLLHVTLDELTWKYNGKTNNLVIAVARLKDVLGSKNSDDIVMKTIDRLTSEKEGNKKLRFDRDFPEKFITLYGAPRDLETVAPIDGLD